MIFGIAAALLFALTAGKFVTQRLHWKNLDWFMGKIHCPLGFAFVGAVIVHSILSFDKLSTRPVYMYVFGMAGLVCGLTAAASYLLRKRFKKKWLTVHRVAAAGLCICIVLHIFTYFYSLKIYQKSVADISYSHMNIGELPNGVYEGECDVTYIFAKVRVTVKSGKITNIVLLEHRNEKGGPAEKITKDIISKQQIDVDAVTGATNSSKVIKKAVENALLSAKEQQ